MWRRTGVQQNRTRNTQKRSSTSPRRTRILNKLREEADKHPAPREAIVEAMQKLEMALAILSVKTGGWL